MVNESWERPERQDEDSRRLQSQADLRRQGYPQTRRRGAAGWWWAWVVIGIAAAIWFIGWGGWGGRNQHSDVAPAAATSNGTAESSGGSSPGSGNTAGDNSAQGNTGAAANGTAESNAETVQQTGPAQQAMNFEQATIPQLLSNRQRFAGHQVVVPRALVVRRVDNATLLVSSAAGKSNKSVKVQLPFSAQSETLAKGTVVEITGIVSTGEAANSSALNAENSQGQGVLLAATAISPVGSQSNSANSNR